MIDPIRREAEMLRDSLRATHEGDVEISSPYGLDPADAIEAAIRRFAERAPETPAPAAWQPIATAPKDGTEILLFGERRIVNGSWNRGGALHCPHWMGGLFAPSHWMPLPQPPGEQC